jgi:hypothetical protein
VLADLEAAQLRKVDSILDSAGVEDGPGDRDGLGQAGDPGSAARP